MDLIGSLRVFTRIAELGSFSAVARELRESRSAVTRQIRNLEEHFGARLFHRNTRGLALTDNCRELLGYARQMLDLAESMENGLGRQRAAPKGLVLLGTTIAGGYSSCLACRSCWTAILTCRSNSSRTIALPI